MLLHREEYERALAQVRENGDTISEDDPRYRRILDGPLDVLYTVPHGAPGNDAIAPPVGFNAYEQSLKQGLKANLLVSVCDRYVVGDMNRPLTRDSNFRRAIRDQIHERRPRVLIDVHSYPDWYTMYSGRDIVLLHTPGVTDKDFLCFYATLLTLAGRKLGQKLWVEVQDQHQPVIHDIVGEAVELGMPADTVMLAEHNEGLGGIAKATTYGLTHALAVKALLAGRPVGRSR
jgi:hypothetical protein